MIKRLLVSFAVGLGLLVAPLAAGAADTAPQNITLSPSSTELSAPPGGSVPGTINVINGGNSAFKVKVYTDAYSVTGLSYDPSFTPLPGRTNPSSWVHFTSPTTVTVGAGQTSAFNYDLNIPVGTAPGGYYAVIFAETLPDAGAGVTSHSRVGNILYITAQGNVVEAGMLKAGPLPPIVVGSTLPLSAQVENTGGLHFITTVKLQLVNPITNKTAYSASLERYVLPQTTRQIGSTATLNAPIGIYKEEVSATILGATQTLPTRWVLIIHPIVLLVIPLIVVRLVIYFSLPKSKKKGKPANKTKGK